MTRSEWFAPKWKWLKRFALSGLVGLLFLFLAGRFQHTAIGTFAFIVAFACLAPLIFWLSFIPILHWKDRYIGNHPNMWGAFMVFETSGWTRIFYWFANVLPDHRRAGKYSELE